MHCEGKFKLRSHNTSYCLIEVVTKAGLTVYPSIATFLLYICNRNIADILTAHFMLNNKQSINQSINQKINRNLIIFYVLTNL
jgi:hypothetical protein